MTKGDTDRPLLTVRGLTTLSPEIVGGNGAIYYSYNIAGASATLSGNNTSTSVTDNGSINYSINTVNNPVTIALGDLIILGDSSDGVPFKFTFWDSTAGGVRFTSTQKAELTVYLAIDTQTLGTPSTTMVPFYWKSLKENSIYKSSTAASYSDLKGHIELGSDWMTTETYAQNAALPAGDRDSLYDADPKVSGKIVIEGSSHDDKLITELKANVFGTAYTAASYNAGNGLLEASHNDFGTRGYYLKITSQTSDSSGHDVSWELYIDTEAAGTVGRDRTVTMQAFNSGVPANVRTTGGAYTGVSGTSGYDYTNGEGTHSAVGNTPETAGYKMDIVPYITEITTVLSKTEENNPSVYSRTALGHYPVYVNFESPLTASVPVLSYEKIKVRGFNLENGTLIFEDGDSEGDANKVSFSYATEQDLSNWASVYPADVPSGAKTGAVNVTVSGIKSLNNINNNDARGSSAKVTDKAEGDYDVYCDYYNRQPNGTNNNRLTDDVNVDVWLFNTAAARPMNNSALDIMMDINPSSGMIGFAFCNGYRNFSMGNLTYSYTNWIRSVDFIQCTGFAYDQDGQSYGLCAGGESNSPKQVDGFVFLTGRWGVPGENVKTADNNNGTLRIETTGQLYDGENADLNKTRFLSPSYASVDGAAGYENVYLAFYDDLNGEIRFRAGALKKSATKKTELDTSGVFGHFRDRFTSINGSGLNAQDYSASENDCQIVANGDGDALGYAGEYVSIGVTSDNVVVMVWYDVENGNLMYTYNEDPLDLHTGTTGDGWEPAVPLLAGAGKYCHIAVDGADGIHVAAYDSSNGDLKYVYLPSYDCDDTEWKNCTVDSYQTVGKELTIDVAAEEFDGTTYYIPHIGYWGNTPKKPRYAYIADPAAFNEAADADARSGTADDCYTGIWECSVVPTKSDMTKDSRRRINVGVWTETKTVNGEDVHGHLKDSVKGTSYAGTGNGKCYGNGTDNAVLGYGVKHSSTQDFVETAQKM